MHTAYPPLDFCPATAATIPLLRTIERACYAAGWTARDFATVLREPYTVGVTAMMGCQAVGYLIRMSIGPVVTIRALAVHPERRRQGVAARLITRVQAQLGSGRRRRYVDAHVHERNLPAQLFFKAQGFRWMATHRGVYGEEDCYQMRFESPECAGV